MLDQKPDEQDAFTAALNALGALKLEAEMHEAPARALAESIAGRNLVAHNLDREIARLHDEARDCGVDSNAKTARAAQLDRDRMRVASEISELIGRQSAVGQRGADAARLYRSAQKAFDGVSDWSRARLAPVDPEKVTGDPLKAIGKIRDELADLEGALDGVTLAPAPRDVLIGRIRDWIDRQIGPLPNMNDFVRGGSFLPSRSFSRGGPGAPVFTDFEALALKACGPAVEAMLIERIDTVTDFKTAISDSDRRAKLATIRAKIADAEHREEATIRAAALNGDVIPRRGDANPWPVLGVSFE